MTGYLFGAGTGIQSAAELQRQRERVDALRESSVSSVPQSFGEGLTAMGQAWAARRGDRKLAPQEAAMRQRNDSAFNQIVQQLSGQSGQPWGSGAPVGSTAPKPRIFGRSIF